MRTLAIVLAALSLSASAAEGEPWLGDVLARGIFSPVNRKPLFRDELMDERDYYPDDYLAKLRDSGVNGVWIVARLRHLAATRFVEPDSDRDRRLAKLRKVVGKCGRFGIKVWLLGIEPHRVGEDDPLYRAHPEMFSPIKWAEHVMCPCRPETEAYLEAAMKDVFAAVPGLGGWINISHGERKTTCLSFVDPVDPKPLGCPACAALRPWEIHARTAGAMSRGIRAANPSARLVSWLYHPEGAETRADWVAELARHVPEGVTLQYNFESGVAEDFGGRRLVAGDYWHSRVGPAAPFAAVARAAKSSGARLSAKIQTSNGHETADIPTVPAPGLLYRKFKAMREAGVRDAMLSWYPGSYPGVMLTAAGMLAREDFADGEDAFLVRLARRTWGAADAEAAVGLWKRMERAYGKYPLSLLMQYYGPFGSGTSWPLHAYVDLTPQPRTWRADDAVDGDTIGECLDNHTLEEVRTIAAEMAAELAPAADALAALRARHAGEKDRLDELGCYEALSILFASAADVFAFHAARREAVTASRIRRDFASARAAVRTMRGVVAREKPRTKRLVELAEADRWLGWHSEAECRLFDPASLEKRLAGLDGTLADLEKIDAELAAGRPYPQSELERRAPVWTATRTAAGGIRIEGESHNGHQVNVYTMDACGTTLAKGYSTLPKDGRFALEIPAADIPADPALFPAWLYVRQGEWNWPEGQMPKGRLLLRRLQGDRFGRLEVVGGGAIRIEDAPFPMPPIEEAAVPARAFRIDAYGARPDGSNARAAIAACVKACVAAGGGRVVVPPGRWVTGAIRLASNVALHLEEEAELVFTQDPSDYLPAVRTSWEGVECCNYAPCVSAFGATNVAITGGGTLRGFEGDYTNTLWYTWARPPAGGQQAMASTRRLYDWMSDGVPVEQRRLTDFPEPGTRPHLVQFNRCRNVLMDGFTVRESPFWTLHVYKCENVVARHLDVEAHAHNTDGIDIESSRNCLVEDSRFNQGDDGFVIKAGRNRDGWTLAGPTENVVIRRCHVERGHTLLGIGSELSGGIRNVALYDCTVGKVYKLFFVKTNPRRGGFVENVHLANVRTDDVRSILSFGTGFYSRWKNFPDREIRLTRVDGLHVSHVDCNACDTILDLVGDARLPARNVFVSDVVSRVVRRRPQVVENVEGLHVSVTPKWPEATATSKPWAYNWWMASAVDARGLEAQCQAMEDAGFGGFHVIPIYGAKGYERHYRSFLSSEWVDAWNLAVRTARRHGLDVDLSMGSGWCFGGPWVSEEDRCSSGMRVKRAGPGGRGYMIDPFSPRAMSNHVARFEAAFGRNGRAERPRAFYHDSYEYFRAHPKRKGEADRMLQQTFGVWTDWCRANGYLTRNEAHGSPGNWLDLYALADIPETEMYGAECQDVLVSKFASSAAHVTGRRLVSSESLTWVGSHFGSTLADCKRLVDRLFLSGVNHVFYHGLCYSPVEAPWPGWCFYASAEMNPRNPVWRDMRVLNDYVTRCQSLFQACEPDEDTLVYWPFSDYPVGADGTVGEMSVDNAPKWFHGHPIGETARRLAAEGRAFDYVSDRMLRHGGLERYADLVVPSCTNMPAETRAAIAGFVRRPVRTEPFPVHGLSFVRLRRKDARVYFIVNTNDHAVACRVRPSARGESWLMDPMTGRIERADETAEGTEIALGAFASEFLLVDESGRPFLREAGAPSAAQGVVAADGPWDLTPVCGGPVLPKPRRMDRLSTWSRTADGREDPFSGTMRYRTSFDLAGPVAGECVLDLGRVSQSARAWINGREVGAAILSPFRMRFDGAALRAGRNELVVEVTSVGQNRLRQLGLDGVKWAYFEDVNMRDYRGLYDPSYRGGLNAATLPFQEYGLFGPVVIQVPARL